MRVVPRTLTGRLVVTAVALVALISVLVALATTITIGSSLTQRLDDQLRGAQERALNGFGGPDGPGPGGFGPGGDNSGNSGGDGDGSETGGSGSSGFDRQQGVRTLVVDLDSSSFPSGVRTDRGTVKALGSGDRAVLEAVPQDGEPHTVDLAVGDFRVVSADSDGDTMVVGLPLDDVHRTTNALLRNSLLLALAGVVLAGGIGSLLVRRQLRPLHEVADTAYDVTAMPLGAGGQRIEARVEPRLTDEATEVGRVGSALNTLLDHVDSALDARHRSEQQVRQFVADASHELRTPLSTIHGYAELSRRTPDDAVALSAAMGKVETEATRMSSLVGDLLLLARLDSGRPLEREEVDVTRLLLEAVTDARVVAPDHGWRLDLPDEPVTVTGDEQRLHQVVTNLINNARRHTPETTTVTVGVTPRTGTDEPVRVTVHDDGPGIAPELAGQVFERFTRGDSSRTRASGGAGLGLSLVQAIAEAHGGEASLESRPGSTTFTIALP